MPTPPGGAGNAVETQDKVVISLDSSSEDDLVNLNNEARKQASLSMDENMSEAQMVKPADTFSKPQEIDKIKYFNLTPDKYNTNNIYVYIEKTNNQNIGRLHPMYVGHIFHKKLKLQNIVDIKSVGKNRIKVQLKSISDANNLVNNSLLNAENLRAYIPNHLLEKKGVIKGVDTFFDVTYLKNNIECSTPISDVKRTHKKIEKEGKTEFVPKQTIIVSFEGNILPNSVIINSVICSVEPFLGRVTQCYNCLKYGHVARQCRGSNTLCIQCGNTKTENHHCDKDQNYCIYCKTNNHISISKNCPYYAKQRTIKKIMVENNVPFLEAKKFADTSYSNIVSENRFQILSNNMEYDTNFPSLTKSQNNSFLTLSQLIPKS